MLGFIFDTVLMRDEEGDFYGINLNYQLWEDRYLPVFKEMIVATRVKDVKKAEIAPAYKIVNGKNVAVRPISAYKKVTDVILKRGKVKAELLAVIKDCDKVIIRMPSPLSVLACKVCRKMGKPYALEMVADPWDGYRYHGNVAGKLVAPIMYWATKRECRKAKRVLYVTKGALQRRYPTNGKTTNASNVIVAKPGEEVLGARLKKIQESGVPYKIGLVGKLDLKSKGQAVAIRALARLGREDPELGAKLELVGPGDGEKLGRLAKELGVEDMVVFRGTIAGGEKMLQWMDSLDVLLLPSFQEGLPRVLIEGMTRAVPALGSDVGGIPELIGSAYIHHAGDERKLAADLGRVLRDKDEAVRMARENFKNAMEYTKEELDPRRRAFWKEFANE